MEEKDVRVAARDGVNLALRVYRPDGADTIHHDAAHPSQLVLPLLAG